MKASEDRTMSTEKLVWLANWVWDAGRCKVSDADTGCNALSDEPWDNPPRHDAGRLVAAAPALARELLFAEWRVESGDNARFCERCKGYGYDGDQFTAGQPPKHKLGCTRDGALSAAGFPDQASRDAARAILRAR
jgi:hypothetical protein